MSAVTHRTNANPKKSTTLNNLILATDISIIATNSAIANILIINKKKAGRLLEGRTWDEVPELRKIA